MKRFVYRAVDKSTGKTVKGVIQATTKHDAGRILLQQGYVPSKLRDQDEKTLIGKLLDRVSTKDRITFTRQFATLVAAGLPMSTSLRSLAEQAPSKAMKAVIEDLLADVEAGRTLGDSMRKHKEVFGDLYLALVTAGETSGTLDYALQRLAEQEEKDANMMSKIRGAMTYPAIILVVIIAVLLFMMYSVVPQVADLYNSMKEPMPALTLGLQGITAFITNFWWLVIGLIVGIVVMVNRFRKTDQGKRFFAKMKLNAPLFNKMFMRLYMSRFARTMEMLLSVGVPMLDALRISGEATANVLVQEQIDMATEMVKTGKALSKALEEKEYILPLIPQMASIGEQSGKIDEMLGKAATAYANELDEQVNSISTMIEPVLMVIMAALIGVVLMGTLMPIYSLVSQIG